MRLAIPSFGYPVFSPPRGASTVSQSSSVPAPPGSVKTPIFANATNGMASPTRGFVYSAPHPLPLTPRTLQKTAVGSSDVAAKTRSQSSTPVLANKSLQPTSVRVFPAQTAQATIGRTTPRFASVSMSSSALGRDLLAGGVIVRETRVSRESLFASGRLVEAKMEGPMPPVRGAPRVLGVSSVRRLEGAMPSAECSPRFDPSVANVQKPVRQFCGDWPEAPMTHALAPDSMDIGKKTVPAFSTALMTHALVPEDMDVGEKPMTTFSTGKKDVPACSAALMTHALAPEDIDIGENHVPAISPALMTHALALDSADVGQKGVSAFDPTGVDEPKNVSVATWNVAAVNNNPFEYWISHDDALYGSLMQGVEQFMTSPGESDVAVHVIFKDAWFSELKALMDRQTIPDTAIVEDLWKNEYRERKAITGFLADKSIGLKRLTSMPDRITSRIKVEDSSELVYRPTVINNYSGSLASLDEWWTAWKDFMFNNVLEVNVKGKVKSLRPCEMLGKISRSKYPALSEMEESVSIPLQILCQAIFDASMVYIMTTLSPDGRWQDIKRTIIDAIYNNKTANTLSILRNVCSDSDIICLQECAATFQEDLLDSFGERFHVCASKDADTNRDQNSIVLLSKKAFPDGVQREVTTDVLRELSADCSVMPGDLCAMIARHRSGLNILVGSFHGDTNGLATVPVMRAMQHALSKKHWNTTIVFGMDANVYLERKSGYQNVMDFLEECETMGLRTCWPDGANFEDCCTTCNARTYLQSQLSKAIPSSQKLTLGDLNPKDHILVERNAFDVVSCIKDNTGERRYIERECFPSLQFPSDHGLVLAVFRISCL